MLVLILSPWKQTNKKDARNKRKLFVRQCLVLSITVELIFNGSQYFGENEAFFSAPQHNFLLPELNQRIYYVLIPRVEVFLLLALCQNCKKGRDYDIVEKEGKQNVWTWKKIYGELGQLDIQFHETLELSWSCWGSLSKEFETRDISHSREMKVIFCLQDSSHLTRNRSFRSLAFPASIPSQLLLSSSAIESESLPSRALSMLAHVIHIIFMMIRTFTLNYFYARSSAQKISLNTVRSVM